MTTFLLISLFVLAILNLLVYFSQVSTVKDLRQQLAQKSTALEAATWAICNQHKENDAKS
jgi:hypothetical protein